MLRAIKRRTEGRTRQSLPPEATRGAAGVVARGKSASSSWPTSFMSGMLSCSLFFCRHAAAQACDKCAESMLVPANSSFAWSLTEMTGKVHRTLHFFQYINAAAADPPAT
eukprot:1157303-Pelagomonas_calceolata.AAC.5